MEKNMFSINENQYKEMTDEKLIENIKQDDNIALNCLLPGSNVVVFCGFTRIALICGTA